MRVATICPAILGLALTCTSHSFADDVKDAKKALTDLGIRTVGSNLAIADETKLGQQLRGTGKTKKALFDAGKQLNGLQQQSAIIQNNICRFEKQIHSNQPATGKSQPEQCHAIQ